MQVKIEGLEKVLAGFQKFPENIRKSIDGEFKRSAQNISAIAQRKSPVDFGRVKSSITVKGSNADYEVVVQSPIGVVQEFGTGKYAGTKTPAEFLPYAATFKGIKIPNTGTLRENILGWVKRKGIGQGRKGPALSRRKSSGQREREQKAVAFLIARKIFRDGIRPHPFLLEAFVEEREKLIDRIIKLIK